MFSKLNFCDFCLLLAIVGGVVTCNSWYKETELHRFKVTRKDVQRFYFLAASSIFEPERASERLAWTQTSILADAISSFFTDGCCPQKIHDEFILNFLGKESSRISSPECFIRYSF
jgi:Terpene synthase family, metal binding domain